MGGLPVGPRPIGWSGDRKKKKRERRRIEEGEKELTWPKKERDNDRDNSLVFRLTHKLLDLAGGLVLSPLGVSPPVKRRHT